MESQAIVMTTAKVVLPSGSSDFLATSLIPYNNIRKGNPMEATPKKNWMKKYERDAPTPLARFGASNAPSPTT